MKPQFYAKRLHFCNATYKLLLTYHNPAGNSIKAWTSYYMKSHILLVRNNIQILDLTHTVIQIRKSLNAVFQRVKYRGCFLIYAQAFNALKLNHANVFIFANAWLPGLISNYRRTIIPLYTYRKYNAQMLPVLTRPQLETMGTITYRAVPKAYSGTIKRRIPPIPSISLSLLDSYTWLNECHNLGIPSIQICDTQSYFDKVSYPIISNQRSVPFSYFIIHLFAEACNAALLDNRLYFNNYYNEIDKVHNSRTFSYKANKKNTLRVIRTNVEVKKTPGQREREARRAMEKLFMLLPPEYRGFRERFTPPSPLPSLPQSHYPFKIGKSYLNTVFRENDTSFFDKKTYLWNLRKAQYYVKELIHFTQISYTFVTDKLYEMFSRELFDGFSSFRWYIKLCTKLKPLRILFKIRVLENKQPFRSEISGLKHKKRWYTRRTRAHNRRAILEETQQDLDAATGEQRNAVGGWGPLYDLIKFLSFPNTWYRFFAIFKTMYIRLLGLKEALRRKRSFKCRFLSQIPLFPRDLPRVMLYSFLTYFNTSLDKKLAHYKRTKRQMKSIYGHEQNI